MQDINAWNKFLEEYRMKEKEKKTVIKEAEIGNAEAKEKIKAFSEDNNHKNKNNHNKKEAL